MKVPFYHVATPTKAMVVSGKKTKDGTPAIYLNQGKWVAPWRQISWTPLIAHTVTVPEVCPTQERVNFNFTAAITFHVGHDIEAINKAVKLWGDGKPELVELLDPATGQMRQTKLNPLESYAKQTLVAHLRGVVGKNTIETIMDDRQALAKTVQDECETELIKMGLAVKSFRLVDITDSKDSTYLKDMGASSRAAIKAKAEIAEATNAQMAVEKQQESEQAQATARRNTAVKNAQLQAQIDAETKTAAQAGPLAEAKAKQEVTTTETETARLDVELTQQRLQTTQIKPAEAARDVAKLQAEGQRQKTEIDAQAKAAAQVFEAEGSAKVAAQAALAAESRAKATIAEGNAEATKVRAIGEAQAAADEAKNKAAAAEGKVSIEQLAITTAPAVAREIAGAFKGSNMTYLNGLEGGMSDMSSLVGMVPVFIEQVRKALHTPAESNGHSANGNGESSREGTSGTPVDRALEALQTQ